MTIPELVIDTQTLAVSVTKLEPQMVVAVDMPAVRVGVPGQPGSRGVDGAPGPAGPPGSVGAGGLALDYTPGPGTLTIDEFNDNTLDPAWIHVDNPSGGAGRVSWIEQGEVLSGATLGGDANSELHALVRPVSVPLAANDALIIKVTGDPLGNNYGMFGIVVADGASYGSGNQLAAIQYPGWLVLTSFTGYNNTSLNQQSTFVWTPTWMRLIYLGSNKWRVDRSPNGIHWTLGYVVTKALSVTHAGILLSSWGSSTVSVVSYEFVRRTGTYG